MAHVNNPSDSSNNNVLSLDVLNKLVGQPPNGIHEEIESIVGEALSLLEDIFDVTVKRPKIVYDLKGTTAGQAQGRTTDGQKEYIIRINNDLLYGKHKEELLRQTIPHEAAHIFVYQVWPGASGHGNEWRSVMRQLGLDAKRCHNYEVQKARKREKMDRPFIYECGCFGVEHKLTKIRHHRILNGEQKYTCRRCGYELTFAEIRD